MIEAIEIEGATTCESGEVDKNESLSDIVKRDLVEMARLLSGPEDEGVLEEQKHGLVKVEYRKLMKEWGGDYLKDWLKK